MIRTFMQLHIENSIQQAFQGCALSITTNPYQGLKFLGVDSIVAATCSQLLLIPIRD